MEKFLYICASEDGKTYLAVENAPLDDAKNNTITSKFEDECMDVTLIRGYYDIEYFLHNIIGYVLFFGGDQIVFFNMVDDLVNLYREFRGMPDMPKTKEKFEKALENKSHEMFCSITNFFPFY